MLEVMHAKRESQISQVVCLQFGSMTLTSVKKQQGYGFTHLDLGVLITKKELTLMDMSAKMLCNTGVNF